MKVPTLIKPNSDNISDFILDSISDRKYSPISNLDGLSEFYEYINNL